MTRAATSSVDRDIILVDAHDSVYSCLWAENVYAMLEGIPAHLPWLIIKTFSQIRCVWNMAVC